MNSSPIREIVYQDDDILVECDYIVNNTKVSIHLTINGDMWTHTFFKKMVNIYKDIVNDFKDRGYTEIYGAPVKGNLKAKKLAKMFGFTDIYENDELYLMKMEIN